MKSKRTHSEKTSADKTAIGFDYQYYYFLWKVLSLNKGESAGLEVLDDVHTELQDSYQILYQLKHTVQQKNDNTAVNMATLDKDLWKTISNWVQVIEDPKDNRTLLSAQLEFISKTIFVLTSNKSSSQANKFINSVSNYQTKVVLIATFLKEINEIKKSTKDTVVSTYISMLINLKKAVLKQFIYKIHFELDENDLIQKCKDAIKADKVAENKINDVFSSIDSAIRADNFINIKQGKKIQISFDDFYLKYQKYYSKGRDEKLIIRSFPQHLPDKLQEQTFIKQILEIEDIPTDDIESIAEFTLMRLKLVNNMDYWLQQGELTSEEMDESKTDIILEWKNNFREHTRQEIPESEFNNNAIKLLDTMRNKKLTLSDTPLKIELSNGYFYELSNEPQIGWRKDWKKYKK